MGNGGAALGIHFPNMPNIDDVDELGNYSSINESRLAKRVSKSKEQKRLKEHFEGDHLEEATPSSLTMAWSDLPWTSWSSHHPRREVVRLLLRFQ